MRALRPFAPRSGLLARLVVFGSLTACNLVVGGEDKILIGLDSTNGGTGGVGAGASTGGGGDTEGGKGGSEAGGKNQGGSAGSTQGGAAGATPLGGAGGSPSGGSSSGTGGTAGSAGGAAGGPPVFLKPGLIDCDGPPVQGTHRFCTDFAPLPTGWAGAGCSLPSAEDGNVYWRWEQNAGSTCASFVNIVLGTPHSSATMAMWLRVDALGLGDNKIALMFVKIGETTAGELAVRVDRDINGAVTGTSLVVQTVEATPQVKVVGALGLGDWRHVRLRVAADGTVRGSFGATTGDTISTMDVLTTSGPAAAPYVELPFRQASPGTGPTRISLDELTVDVAN